MGMKVGESIVRERMDEEALQVARKRAQQFYFSMVSGFPRADDSAELCA